MSIPQKKGYIESFQVKDVDLSTRSLVQAYTRYNVKDSDGDIGRKGMFTKTWSENASRIKHLFNHKDTIGVTVKLWDDNDYAYGQSKIGTHDLGNDFLEMADSGLITEASYGYEIIKERRTSEGNELLEVKMWEWSSLDKWGANEHTHVVSLAKSMGKDALLDKYTKRMDALVKFCRTTTATDYTIQLLLKEVEELQQHIIELSSTEAATNALQPQEKDSDLLLLDIALKNQLFKFQTS